jgi:hypothetical protein
MAPSGGLIFTRTYGPKRTWATSNLSMSDCRSEPGRALKNRRSRSLPCRRWHGPRRRELWAEASRQLLRFGEMPIEMLHTIRALLSRISELVHLSAPK